MSAVTPRSVLVHGRAVNCVEAGSGPVLLLIHGMAGNIGNWQEVIALGHVTGQLGRPRQVAAGVSSGRPAVEHHGGVRHDTIEGHQHPPARDGGAGDVLAVYPDAFP